MDLKQLLQFAHDTLQAEGIEHALIGGLALGALGIQRFTNDVDFLVPGNEKLRVKHAFLSRGFTIHFESHEVLQLIGSGSLDFLFANRALTKAMLTDATTIKGMDIKCLRPEDIIGLKIQAYKNAQAREFHDKADILAIMQRYPDLEWNRIKLYADVFGEWKTICGIRKRVSSP